MFWTLLALLLLVVTGGFISYFGDLQGRRWGKKRVSWFGLRPKHTAILITSITGGVIAFLSVAALMLVVPNVRDVVLRGENAIREYKVIARRLDSASARLKETAGQLATVQAALNENNKQLARAAAENEQAQQKNAHMQRDTDRLVAVNMDLQRRKFSLESNYRSLEENIRQEKLKLVQEQKENANAANINRDLSRQTIDLVRQNAEMERERYKLTKANAELKSANQALLGENAGLKESNTTLTKIKSQLEGAYSGLLNETQSMEDKNNRLQAQLKERQGELDDLSRQRDDLYRQLAGTNRNFVQTYLALRQARFKLRTDTELARRTLDAHLSPKAVKEELLALLKDASDRAKQYGAVNGDNGRAVCIVPKRLVTPASVQMADESASLNAIVDEVAGSNTPVVVVARAINNSIADEQVLVEVSSYTSVNVFKKGEVVASRPIDSRQPLDRLVQSVINFLKEDVRSAAIKAGTIPQISPETGEEEVGIIDTPEMVNLVDRIRRMGGMVQLNAVANASLTSADLLTFGQSQIGKPLNLRFELRRQSGRAGRKGEARTN